MMVLRKAKSGIPSAAILRLMQNSLQAGKMAFVADYHPHKRRFPLRLEAVLRLRNSGGRDTALRLATRATCYR